MVNISKHDFNRDLDEYISKKREKDNFYDRKRMTDVVARVRELFKKKDNEEINTEKIYEDNTESVDVNETDEIIPEEDIDELPPRRSFFARIFGWSSRGDYYEEDIYAEEESVDTRNLGEEVEDLKEVVKILHKWIEKLPSDKINQFKRSDDFVKYKELLDKHGMIKK